MRNPTSNDAQHRPSPADADRLRGVLSSLLLAVALPALADDEVNERYLSDSTSDRTPAVTAFPRYPSIARRDRIEGEAVVCFTIDPRGRIIRPSIRSSTHRIFHKPAMRAIRRSSFEPLAPGETLARAKTCRTYRFRLDPVTTADNSRVEADRRLH